MIERTLLLFDHCSLLNKQKNCVARNGTTIFIYYNTEPNESLLFRSDTMRQFAKEWYFLSGFQVIANNE